jgi:phosphatidylserine/phosphatidylglycerophosphate/cardiolipin synthase-like enzyme
MRRKFLVGVGLSLMLAAFGLTISDDFLAHYNYVVKKTAAVAQGELVAPIDIKTPPPDYFSLITQPGPGNEPVVERINAAEKSIDLVMYSLDDTAVVRALADAVVRGVSVRVLLNGGYYAKHETNNDASYNALKTASVPVRWTPTAFALTHQKTLVVDGDDALVMTFNVQSKYYATGRDFAVDDTDPADVSAIEKTFSADWDGDSISAPHGDTLVWSPGSEDELIYLIDSATSTLDIYNEEMDDADITHALERAASRGVSVRVVMTYATNWKAAFTELVQAGVGVRTFASSSKKIYIHAKVILVDGTEVFIGSENFSDTSMNKNRELGLVLSSAAVIRGVGQVFDADWAGARPFVVKP